MTENERERARKVYLIQTKRTPWEKLRDFFRGIKDALADDTARKRRIRAAKKRSIEFKGRTRL